MIIMSYDKKSIVKAKTLTVQKNFAGKKEEKYAIVAQPNELTATIAAVYPDEKTAVDALQRAYRAFAEGAACYSFE